MIVACRRPACRRPGRRRLRPLPTIRSPPTGCACPAAPTSARRRSRPPRSIPTAMARPASRRSPRTPRIDCFYVYPTVSRDRGHQQRPHARRRRGEGARSPASSPASPAPAGPIAPIYRQMTVGAIAAVAAGADVTGADGDRLWRRPRRLAGISRQAQQGPPVRPHRPQPGLAGCSSMLIANEIEGKPVAQADEAGDHPRLQRAGAAGQAASAAPSSRPRSARRPARPAA